MTALERTSSNCKRQTRPLVREGAPLQRTRNYLTVIKMWSWGPVQGLAPRQTGRLTAGRNITLTLVAEARDSSGTHRKENVGRWKPLPSNDSEDVTMDTNLCVTVNCKM
jgi:hypothetical protein